MASPFLEATNPLTFFKLLETLVFQVGVVGGGTVLLSLKVVPMLAKRQGMHPIGDTDRRFIGSNFVLRAVFGKARRFYDHIWWSLLSTTVKAISFIFVTFVMFVLLTDAGWADAFRDWSGVMAFLMARAGGVPNGAHLLSYIPLPALGVYTAWKFRAGSPGADYLGDMHQAILLIGFGVAFHELPWLAAYWATYAKYWNLGVATNVMEDVGFSVMCVMLFYAYWKYPYRRVKMSAFVLPLGFYGAFIAGWWAAGLPVTTINNWQLGSGVFEVTRWWADPWVNAVEIASWVMVAMLFFAVVKAQK